MSEIETVKTKIETTALDFINKHKIPYVKLSITYKKNQISRYRTRNDKRRTRRPSGR